MSPCFLRRVRPGRPGDRRVYDRPLFPITVVSKEEAHSESDRSRQCEQRGVPLLGNWRPVGMGRNTSQMWPRQGMPMPECYPHKESFQKLLAEGGVLEAARETSFGRMDKGFQESEISHLRNNNGGSFNDGLRSGLWEYHSAHGCRDQSEA